MDAVELIDKELARQLLSPRVILGRCQTLDHASKESIAFQDNTHLPFYYYLGKHLPRESVVNVGFGIGFPLVCYLLSRPPALDLCVQQDPAGEYYHPRLGLANLRTATKQKPRVFVGPFTDEGFHSYLNTRRWGAAVVCGVRSYDEVLQSCESLWKHLKADGYVCLEGVGSFAPVSRAFDNFCTLTNREGHRVRSRYGHGIVFKG